MDRLRKAYLALGTVLVPAATIYLFHVAQNPTTNVSRAEAALRAAISVGGVIWAVLWSAHILAQDKAHRPIVARARVLQETAVQLPVISQPTGLDPHVMDLGRRIARGLDRAPTMRQEG